MDLTMTDAERQAFLADVHVGVISVERPDGPPLSVPVWYVYEPGGELWVLTDATSRKGRLLERARRFSLCAQREDPMAYAYVTVEGPVTSAEPADREAHRRPLAHRYLGPDLGDRYIARTDEAPTRYAMRPERWWTVDYTKMNL
jgi:nitroimidazol reductase NimA-like FMN-containing flavoprotein (pyridoxamine 5'-phosphate oxidase superfamily)